MTDISTLNDDDIYTHGGDLLTFLAENFNDMSPEDLRVLLFSIKETLDDMIEPFGKLDWEREIGW